MMDFDFRSYFLCKWNIQRSISGVFPTKKIIFATAVFTDCDQDRNLITYNEDGRYIHDGSDIAFSNSYLYEISDNSCKVLFPDKKFFYELTGVNQIIHHICGQDIYQGEFKIESKDKWHLNWLINGPRKNGIEIHNLYIANTI